MNKDREILVKDVKREIERLKGTDEVIDKRNGKARRLTPTQFKTTNTEKSKMLGEMLADGHVDISEWIRERLGL